MSQLLKNVLLKKMEVKHALDQYRKMIELTELNYEKEINYLLDQLSILERIENELSTKK